MDELSAISKAISKYVPRYKNWGGPDHDGFYRENGRVQRDPDTNEPLIIPGKEPADDLDRACYRHDLVYLDFEENRATRLDDV